MTTTYKFHCVVGSYREMSVGATFLSPWCIFHGSHLCLVFTGQIDTLVMFTAFKDLKDRSVFNIPPNCFSEMM